MEMMTCMRLLDDPKYLSNTLGSIYDCILRPEGWQAVMMGLAKQLGARRAFLGAGSSSGKSHTMVVEHGLTFGPEEAARYNPINPIMPLALVWPLDKAMVVSRDYGLDQLRATRYYREYLAPRGDLDAVAFAVAREGDLTGHWLIVCQDDRGPVTELEIAGLELIAPHLRRAVEISRVLGMQTMSADTYQAALGQLDSVVLILSGDRKISYANPKAKREIADGRVLQLRDGRLHGATDSAEDVLRRAAKGAIVGSAGGFEATIVDPDGQERLMFAVCLDGENQFARNARSVMLVLRSPREDTRNPIAIAARAFGLTNAQVQVLTFLAQGNAPEVIAGILGITDSTVRSHLKSLFGKTGTSRQAELVARALSLVSPLRQT